MPTDAAGTDNCDPDGSGIGTIDQLRPFHCSANTPTSEAPTAKHRVVLEQDTAVNVAADTPFGFGLATIDQLAPFQCSTNVLNDAFSEPVSVEENPTAEQSVALAHDTSESTPSTDPPGFGLGTIDQLVPFHRSINVAVDVLPTAKQLVDDVHDTPARPAPPCPAGCGLGTTDHTDPSHLSINDAENVPPTAKQLDADTHDTAETEPLGGPGGLGLATTDQPAALPAGTATAASIPATRPTATSDRTKQDRRERQERFRGGAPTSSRMATTFPFCSLRHQTRSQKERRPGLQRAGPKGQACHHARVTPATPLLRGLQIPTGASAF